ncbi:ABC transporter substrate-binding protein [Anaerobium acetethylicum]|uniref:Putative aldouronate transport system substrate-binding protein n=1 Tax=Anaerobium acetethylicum TaxID=1619234 RepID=A0A1D3TTR0_9FIRM|nr:ABC transporter substrate-binding protein [Anaerobium acetethylicum]SCP97401.1 putative aldouronate transport system substrate-binding protein [Anaerobium acetethylicum]
MKKWKRVLSVVMMLIMALTMVTGCSSKKSDEDPAKNVTDDKTATDNGEEPYELVIEVVNISQSFADIEAVQEAINEITVPEINCTVKLMTVPIFEQGTRLSMMVAGNEKIDLVNTGLLTSPSTLVGEGLLADITEYITPTMKELAGDLLAAGTFDGKVYSYPAILYPGTVACLFYDKDLAEQYGIEVPEAISKSEDWENILKQVKDSGMSAYGISLGDGGGASIMEFGANLDGLGDNNTLSYGVVVDPEENTTITNWYESEDFAQLCNDHYDWMQKGYCVPDSLTNGYTTIDSMANGECFAVTSSNSVGMSQAYLSNLTGKNLEMVMVREALLTTGYVNTQSWGVASNSENPEKAVQFLDLLFQNAELANLMNYGIEGSHYAKVDGTQNIVAFPEGKDASTVGYGGDIISWFGDTKTAFQRTPNTDEFFDTIDDYGLEGAKKSLCLGFTFDTSKVATQVAAVQSVVGEYKPTLTTGNVNPDEVIPEFIKALKDAGIDEVIKENQSQLDAWLKTK